MQNAQTLVIARVSAIEFFYEKWAAGVVLMGFVYDSVGFEGDLEGFLGDFVGIWYAREFLEDAFWLHLRKAERLIKCILTSSFVSVPSI